MYLFFSHANDNPILVDVSVYGSISIYLCSDNPSVNIVLQRIVLELTIVSELESQVLTTPRDRGG